MPKELPAITPTPDYFWRSIVFSFVDNFASIQHVIMKDPATNEVLGDFDASLVKEEQRLYLQIENVSKDFSELILDQGMDCGWQICIGGIYRIPITPALLKL